MRPSVGGGEVAVKGELSAGLEAKFTCGARCAAMSASDRATVEEWLLKAGCGDGRESDETTCDASPEQICITACAGGSEGLDMKQWLPGAFGSSGTGAATPERLAAMREGYAAHLQCAEGCAESGVSVDVNSPNATARALDSLSRCGVVQFEGAWDLEELDLVRKSVDILRSQEGRYAALLDRKQLRGGRYQLYLPFVKPFDSRASLGVRDGVVFDVLKAHFGEKEFGIDHVTVLSSAAGSDAQGLHPDVPYYQRLHGSVHTALDDITLDMGPTYFCPCTGVASNDWATNAAIRMETLMRKDCLGRSFVRELTPRGTVTVYDGVTFHRGSANPSGKERHVLKLELGADDFPVRRDYIKGAPDEGRKQMHLFRKAFGPPAFGPA